MINNRTAAFVLLLAATSAAAMGRRPPARTEKSTMTVLEWKGQSGGPPSAGNEVASDAAAWTALWSKLGQAAPPDFSAFVAVAAYAGQKNTGGWSPVFDEPVAKDADLIVRYRIAKPSGFATQVITQPWKVRAFARPKGRVIVEAAPE